MDKKVIVIGGVAGGANFCTRARRLSEKANLILIERGPYVSFANCGLPYHIGGEIKERKKLLVQTPESLRARYNLDVRVSTEALRIFPERREIELRDLSTARTYLETYDELVLSPGAAPIIPPLPGTTAPGVFTLRTIDNLDAIMHWMDQHNPKSAVVIGGGYVGLEVLEQLHHRIPKLTVIEAAPQLMGPLDSEMAILIEQEIRSKGVQVIKDDALSNIQEGSPLTITTKKGVSVEADLVILAIGVRPEVMLAKEAGLKLGQRGGIAVNEFLQTSDPHIWALGDAIEVRHIITGEVAPIPLAGPANRQGRLIADNIFGKRQQYPGTLGTAIVRVFGLTAATTGANERTLKRLARSYRAFYFYLNSHAGYYPGAASLAIKVLACPETRQLLGAQIIGKDGVDKRIDVLATAILSGLTVDDLAQLELAYAPPFGSAKDPVNIIGMAIQNALDGLVDTITPAQLHELFNAGNSAESLLLDVRDADEFAEGAISGAVNIPLHTLRDRVSTLDHSKSIVVYCASAQRSYYASRILAQHGFKVRNLTGAYRAWSQFQQAQTA
jgi:NADPH-dependent 2,4-dienoyl-CoA reductase/sulfur reductase-like enzyme/rhodanese-related sulfurtransferase